MRSTRRQKVNARKSREMDMISDFKNMDVILGNENTNLMNVNYQMLLEIQKTIVTLSQIQSSEGIIHRKITSGNIAMKVHFQGKIGSRKQWKPLLVN